MQNSFRTHSELIQNQFRIHPELVQSSFGTHWELVHIFSRPHAESIQKSFRVHPEPMQNSFIIESEFKTHLEFIRISARTHAESIQSSFRTQAEAFQNLFRIHSGFIQNSLIIHSYLIQKIRLEGFMGAAGNKEYGLGGVGTRKSLIWICLDMAFRRVRGRGRKQGIWAGRRREAKILDLDTFRYGFP